MLLWLKIGLTVASLIVCCDLRLLYFMVRLWWEWRWLIVDSQMPLRMKIKLIVDLWPFDITSDWLHLSQNIKVKGTGSMGLIHFILVWWDAGRCIVGNKLASNIWFWFWSWFWFWFCISDLLCKTRENRMLVYGKLK